MAGETWKLTEPRICDVCKSAFEVQFVTDVRLTDSEPGSSAKRSLTFDDIFDSEDGTSQATGPSALLGQESDAQQAPLENPSSQPKAPAVSSGDAHFQFGADVETPQWQPEATMAAKGAAPRHLKRFPSDVEEIPVG